MVGTLQLRRTEVNPFTDKQIALLGTFAAQAVIAIENARLLNELRQSLDQQTATSEVLRVISSSPGELEPVFKTMLENATRICEANFGVLQLCEGGGFRIGTTHNAPPALVQGLARRELIFGPTSLHHLARVAATKQVVQVSDLAVDEAYKQRDPGAVRLVELAGARTVLCVPMLKESELIGAIVIYRQEVRPFTDKQIALVRNFAAQGVIAIENARLLNELRESLEQQTATADVLRIISSSPGELEPVFQAILKSATRICEAKFGILQLYDDGAYQIGAMHNVPAAFVEFRQRNPVFRPGPNTVLGRLARTKQVTHIDDMMADHARDQVRVPFVELSGARTYVTVPMLKDDALIGAITIFRQEVRPFLDKQIVLVQNFAAQAVIAIENTRLLNELRQRTDDLTESLEQQTATADVLGVISSSPGELEPVFNSILLNAIRICGAKFGALFLTEGDAFRHVAQFGAPAELVEARRREPIIRPLPGSVVSRVAATNQPIQIEDIRKEPAYTTDPKRVPILEFGGARTMLSVPMLQDNDLVGQIAIYRQEVRPFTEKQIELVKNFAAQAVIAIENARLLNELRESLEQQTATSEVLQVISSSPGALNPVFEAILDNAVRICRTHFGVLLLFEGGRMRVVAMKNAPRAFAEMRRRDPYIPLEKSILGSVVRTHKLAHVSDITAEEPYASSPLAKVGGARTALGVPMLKEDELVGAIVFFRQEVMAFSEKEIKLLQNLAAQAVIAIENARLLNELRQRTDDLGEALEQQTATSEVLKVISSSPGELEPVFHTVLENAVKLCEAKFGTLFLFDGICFRVGAAFNVPAPLADYQAKTGAFVPPPGLPLARLVETKKVAHMLDDPEGLSPATKLGGARTHIAVPMLKEGKIAGAIYIYRQEVKPFAEKQIELVQNFAAQAVIAIENARLLNELRQRTDDLSEALEQQTATSQVLGVISSSPGELEPVFQAMLENAVRICDAKFGVMFRFDNEAFKAAALFGVPPALADFIQQRGSFQPHVGTNLERMWRTKDVVRIIDDSTEPVVSPAAEFGGARSLISVPMIKENVLIGAIIIYRQEVRPFTDKQIALVQNFAAQAVIAIENARLLNELRESLEQQTATSEVLRVISSSQGELEPVFQAMLANATRICGAEFGMLWLVEGDGFRPVALHGLPPALAEMRQHDKVFYVDPETPLRRLAQTKQLEHIADATREPAYIKGLQPFKEFVDVFGARTFVMVPMLKDAAPLGAMAIYRKEVRPFTDKQIALVQNFAAQAVIAIENARLLNELRESLQQQTATSEVLSVISSSPGELKPVFQAMLENAVRICEAKFGVLYRFDGGAFHFAADVGTPQEYREFNQQRGAFQPIPGGQLERVMLTKQVSHTADNAAWTSPGMAARLAGARAQIAVPMLKEGTLIGAIIIYRQEVRPFTDKQIELVKNFAAQAVIAIENTRLLNELRESLQQQTATAEVLQVINSSPGELAPVFDAMIEKARALCEAPYGNMMIREGERFRAIATHAPAPFAEIVRRGFEPHPSSPLGRLKSGERVIHIADLAETARLVPDDPIPRMAIELGRVRTVLMVPLIKNDTWLGVFTLWRPEVRPFSDREIAVVQNFAAQAVIAIENARLLSELRESLQQQTATADVLKVISRSTFDLKTVLNTLVESATHVCEADMGIISRPVEGGIYRIEASHGLSPALAEAMASATLKIGKGSVTGRTALAKAPVHILDAQADPDYELHKALKIGDWHTMLGVPLIREGNLIGVFGLSRKAIRAFTDKQVELVTTFADQAVIAIENVRLFDEIQDKSRQLEEASQHKSQFLANMSHERARRSMPSWATPN